MASPFSAGALLPIVLCFLAVEINGQEMKDEIEKIRSELIRIKKEKYKEKGIILEDEVSWTKVSVTDPISGKVVEFEKPNIKLNETFWGNRLQTEVGKTFVPFSEEKLLWFSEETGYIAFGPDFENISEGNAKLLARLLQAYYDPSKPPKTRLERLQWLEFVNYLRRDISASFNEWFAQNMLSEFWNDKTLREDYASQLVSKARHAIRLRKQHPDSYEGVKATIVPLRWELAILLDACGKETEAAAEYQKVLDDLPTVHSVIITERYVKTFYPKAKVLTVEELMKRLNKGEMIIQRTNAKKC